MDKYRVTLTAEERADLEQLVSCGKAAARKLTHARILLLADDSLGDERPDEHIAAALGTSLRTVSRVRHQLVTEGVDVAILRRRQPPRPDKIKIKGDVEQRLVQLACSDPPVGRCHWTLELLADEMVVLGLVTKVSTETMRQALKKQGAPLAGIAHSFRTLSGPPDSMESSGPHVNGVVRRLGREQRVFPTTSERFRFGGGKYH